MIEVVQKREVTDTLQPVKPPVPSTGPDAKEVTEQPVDQQGQADAASRFVWGPGDIEVIKPGDSDQKAESDST